MSSVSFAFAAEVFVVADNSTEAGRAQNRRISLRVTQK
jgi:flagellar motor protein MotB